MSQLDITISFNQIVGFLFCFYIFLFYFMGLIIKFYYNDLVRDQSIKETISSSTSKDNTILLRKILSL